MALKNTWVTGETFAASDANNVATEILGINAAGVFASRPAAGHPGRTYDCTDNGNRYQDNGTSWDLTSVGGTGLAGTPPASSGWSTTTLGSTTVAADKDCYLMSAPAQGATDTLRIQYRTLSPTSNYTATACLELGFAPFSGPHGFLAVGDGTKWVTIGISFESGGATWFVSYWNSSTSLNSRLFTGAASSIVTAIGLPKWWRIKDDGTTRFYQFSSDGIDFSTVYSEGRTTTLTPTLIGWGMNPRDSGYTALLRLRSLTGVA
jgi:hypothetical protein